MEKTLVLIKPDGVKRNLIGKIINYYEEGGLNILSIEGPLMADEATLKKHYPLDDYNYVLSLGHVDVSNMSEEEKKTQYDKSYKIVQDLTDYLSEGPIVKILIEGDNAVARVREITGKTNPPAAAKGTIRGDFGEDSFEAADVEKRAVRNLIHASDADGAKAEVELWFSNYNG